MARGEEEEGKCHFQLKKADNTTVSLTTAGLRYVCIAYKSIGIGSTACIGSWKVVSNRLLLVYKSLGRAARGICWWARPYE